MSEIIIGLNAYHGDSSACIVVDGRLLAAAEEERFRRVKHWAGFPSEAVRYCLEYAGVKVADVDFVAVNSNPRAAITKKISYAFRRRPDAQLILDRIRNATKRQSIESEFEEHFPGDKFKGKVERVEHHLCHLASAFYCSPFEDATAVSIDAFGDFASAAWGHAKDGRIEAEGRIYFPHSMGVFYRAITQFLGFPKYGDEYKVMGLAPYGKPTYLRQMEQVVKMHDDGTFELDLQYFRHHKEKIDEQWSGGYPELGTIFAASLANLLGPARDPDAPMEAKHWDIAHSCQAHYEQVFFNLLNNLQKKHGTEAVVVAGGCGMNSVANGKIRRRSSFKASYIQPAAGDAGGAVGAALELRRHLHGDRQNGIMPHAYWGPSSTDDEIAEVLKAHAARLEAEGCTIERIDEVGDLCRRTAAVVAEGKVVGWFQGRMEWGPRALGNRSIVCDPRRADMKDILNLKIKRRESFRPFAPSILREHVSDWFEEDDDVPFMMKVFQIREEKRKEIPAVTHVDGSGRLQTVEASQSERYYGLISAFKDLTGVPIVLNTSFNENEPIVCKPQEALDCFLRTKMDLLVMENHFVQRTSD